MKKKYIIGLGCSWTQGEGGYPENIWQEYGGRVQIRHGPDHHLRVYEHENSWVNVLARDHFPDHTPVNLGARGIGNRAAVNQLHFCDVVDWSNSEGIIVFMMSGFERFDFFQEQPWRQDGLNDTYSNGDYPHYKFRTIWPIPGCGGPEEPLYNVYGKMLWSEQFVALEQMMTLLHLQNFARLHGFKVVIANGFNQNHPMGIKQYLTENAGPIVNKFDWSGYLHDEVPYVAFVQKLVWLDGILDPKDWGMYHNTYKERSWPAKYLTNCEGAHPTIDGYKVIGDELAQFIKTRGYVN